MSIKSDVFQGLVKNSSTMSDNLRAELIYSVYEDLEWDVDHWSDEEGLICVKKVISDIDRAEYWSEISLIEKDYMKKVKMMEEKFG